MSRQSFVTEIKVLKALVKCIVNFSCVLNWDGDIGTRVWGLGT